MNRVLHRIARIPPTALLGMTVVCIYAVLAIFAHWIAPYGEAQIMGSQYEPWGAEFLLGTDNLGRDMFSRLIYGARNSVGIALLITALSFSVGSLLGMFAAVRGGWIDAVLSWIVDILMAIPQLIYALLLLTIF